MGALDGKQMQFADNWGKPLLRESSADEQNNSESDFDDWKSPNFDYVNKII